MNMKEIANTNGKYFATPNGDIFSNYHGKMKKLAQDTAKSYNQIAVLGKKRYIHRLIAETFLAPADGLVVNHKDGNKRNNNVDNLEWITRSENNIHSYRVLNRTRANMKLSDDDVRNIRKMFLSGMASADIVKVYPSVTRDTLNAINRFRKRKTVI